MNKRAVWMLPTVAAVAAVTLVAAPVEAASSVAQLNSKNIAISSSGKGKVAISCTANSTCKGTLKFKGSSVSTKFSVPAKKTIYQAVKVGGRDSANPHYKGTSKNNEYDYKAGQSLTVSTTSPRRGSTTYRVTTETYKARQEITGRIRGLTGSNVTDIRVDMIRLMRGGNSRVIASADGLKVGGRFQFRVSLGDNNSAAQDVRLRISGRDQDGVVRTWYWRGKDNKPTAGGRYLREASRVTATKSSDFNADFVFGSIQGTAPTGTTVMAVAAPDSFKGGAAVLRELDFVGCANTFGETVAKNGTYRIDFLPYRANERQYMVSARRGGLASWYGRSTTRQYGSCFDVGNYKRSTSGLLSLNGNRPTERDVRAATSGIDVAVNGSFAGFTPTEQGDRWVRLREKVPGMAILDSPVVDEGLANSKGDLTLRDVPPGNYWVELGRRTGCADWYSSRFPNNSAYFKGADRGGERWKAFTKLSSLSAYYERMARNADPNPATSAQNKIKSGSKGWMYRSHCRANGAGAYTSINISDQGSDYTERVSVTSRKGATVSGRVTRTEGRTNQEMLVRLSSVDGKRVLRTAMTDGSGRFTVSGLPSGNWTIAVNTDSWRGIGRSFTGRKSIRVTAGKSYSVGTLNFNG